MLTGLVFQGLNPDGGSLTPGVTYTWSYQGVGIGIVEEGSESDDTIFGGCFGGGYADRYTVNQVGPTKLVGNFHFPTSFSANFEMDCNPTLTQKIYGCVQYTSVGPLQKGD